MKAPTINFREHMPPVLFISMEKSVERRQSAIQVLDELGLTHQWIKACDGRELSIAELKQVYDPTGTLTIHTEPLRRGEIGCYLSHLECYRAIVDQDIPYAVIMEDDMRPNANLIKVLHALELPEDWGTVNLFPHWRWFSGRAFMLENTYYRKPLFDSHYVSKYFDWANCAAMYLISQEYAREMLSYLLPIRLPVDRMLFDTFYSKNFPYAVYSIEGGKPMRPHLGDFLGGSDIDETDTLSRHSRLPAPLMRHWLERVIARMRLPGQLLLDAFCSCLSILRYLPWSDEGKAYEFDRPRSRSLVGRYCMLVSACRWSALLPWRS
jgi:GR25 family glycosyltransferase involved in LPS biosynthesis